MKNIEKFQRTKDAIEAWGKYRDDGGALPFAAWADQEVALPTLLEAAENVKTTWESQWQYGSLSVVAGAIGNLSDAIDREKAKPVRNCDRYETGEDAYGGFRKFCDNLRCGNCKIKVCGDIYGGCECLLAWLYEEADKEKVK